MRGIRKIEAQRTGTPRPATVLLLADAFGLTGVQRERFCEAALGAVHSHDPPPAADGLIGRDAEFAALLAAADDSRSGRFTLVWISGEAGAGKSALGRALTAALLQQGWRTAWGRSPEVDGAPSAWAWSDVVRSLLNAGAPPQPGTDRADHLRQPGTGETPLASAFWTARAVVDFLRGGAAPVLVVLDDVHRAGEETLQILRYVAAELADRPVLVAATLRPTEAGAALSATRAALAGPRTVRVEVGGLAERDVGQLLHDRLGSVVAPEMVRLITARTGGNPLFVGETARLIADKGFAAAAELVPDGVGDVLRRRLACLPPTARAALRTAAVFGIEVEVEVLLSLDPTAAEVVLDGLEAAVRAGLLIEPAPGVVRFSHVLVRDTIYQDLPNLRRVGLHAQVLDALERIRPGDVRALAHHALAGAVAGTARSAAARGAEAGRAALEAEAYADATTLLAGALEVLGRAPDPVADHELRLDLLCMLVSARAHAGDVRGARQSRTLAIRLAGELGDDHALACAYASYDAPTLWTNRQFQEPDHVLIDGLEATLARVPPDDPATRCRLLATLALETEATDPERTDEAGREALEIAHRLDDPVLICRALNARYRFLATLGPDRWDELDDIGKQQLDVAVAHGLTGYRTQAHHILCMARLARNDLDRAQWHLDRAAEHAGSGQLALSLGIIAMFQGLRELVAGRFDEAELAYAPVIAQLRHVGSPNIDEVDLLIRFCVEHARPAADRRQRMADLAALAEPIHQRYGDAVVEPYVRLLIAAGRPEQARALLHPDRPIPRDHYWFRWTALRAENAVHFGDLEAAAQCYRQLLPWRGHLPGLLHAHVALGPIDQTLGDLAGALGRPEAAAGHYADAITVAERLGATHWADRARTARTARQAGD